MIYLYTLPGVAFNAPQFSIPLIKGYLKTNKIESKQIDLSIKFFEKCVNSNYIKRKFNDYYFNLSNSDKKVVDDIDKYIDYLKCSQINTNKIIKSNEKLLNYLNIYSNYYNINWNRKGIEFNIKLSTIDEVLNFALDKENKIFDIVLKTNYKLLDNDVHYLSIQFPFQLPYAIRIAKKIKRNSPNCKVIFGGDYITHIIKNIVELMKKCSDIDAIVLFGNHETLVKVIYGYRKDNGKLVIDEEQAEIVKKIFELYVYEGIGTTKLSFLLYNEYGFTNSRGNPIHPANIRDIIRNPKYKGYYCANKGISLDFRTKKRKFYSKDKWIVYKDNENVPPIVSEELWEKANEILDSRGNKHSSEDKSVYVKRYPLSGKIYCAHDNSLYVRGNYKLKSGKKVYWACDNYRRNGIAKSSGCKLPLLYEEKLKNVFKPIIQRIINEKEEIIEEIKDILNEAKLQGSYIKEKEKYANDIKQYERQKDELFDMRSKQEITPKEFIEFKNKLDIKIDETKKAIDKIIAIEENINSSCESVETLKRNIESIILDDDNSVFEIASSFLFEDI